MNDPIRIAGRRGVAVAAGTGLAVASYLADAIGGLDDRVAWPTDLSPWSWYLAGDPMRNGVDATGYGLLALVIATSVAIALVSFARRDLGS